MKHSWRLQLSADHYLTNFMLHRSPVEAVRCVFFSVHNFFCLHISHLYKFQLCIRMDEKQPGHLNSLLIIVWETQIERSNLHLDCFSRSKLISIAAWPNDLYRIPIRMTHAHICIPIGIVSVLCINLNLWQQKKVYFFLGFLSRNSNLLSQLRNTALLCRHHYYQRSQTPGSEVTSSSWISQNTSNSYILLLQQFYFAFEEFFNIYFYLFLCH